MDRKKTRLFVRRWLWYTTHDAFAQTFGWLSLIGSTFGGFILANLGIHAASNQFTSNVVGAFGGFVIGLGIYAIVAVFKTRRYMHPLALMVTDDVRSPELTFNDQVRGYSVAAVVRNRSDVYLKDCIAYIMNVAQANGTMGPRFVDQFDLPPKSKKHVFLAYWFSRESPNIDDKDIGLNGPAGNGFWGNMCRIPKVETDLHIRIQLQDANTKDIHCRVWIDTAGRCLRATQLPD